ncbi:MAG: indole-3-glycerol phosphate synthase TrpC [Candidatus Eiseniibacteriota bacterium]|jgi:indole-3-glycerol phosphate synthase
MNILERIAESQRADLARRRRQRSLRDLRDEIDPGLAPRGCFGASLRRAPGDRIRFICEIKRASPSAGVLRQRLDPSELARTYEASGAAAISVVTEERFFLGDRETLRLVRQQATCPVLMKDFVIDAYQLVEARWLGADAVLLIAALLDRAQLASLLAGARELQLEVLVEVHDEAQLEASIEAGAPIVGINNRDLTSFQVTLETTERLSRLLPVDRILVSESGIKTRDDVLRLECTPVDALLVGETLMRAARPGETLWRLMGR